SISFLLFDLRDVFDGRHATRGTSCTGATKTAGGSVSRAASCVPLPRSLRQRIRPHLDVHGAGLRSLAAFHQPRRAVAAGAPQTAALPAGVRIVDAPVQALGVEAHGIWDAQRDHLSVLERDEAVVQVRGRDRNVLPQARRVVVIDPTVVARLGAGVLEAVEARARISVVREASGAVIAGRLRAVERGLAPATVEADQRAVRARPPQDAVLVDVAPAHADAFLRNRVELRQLRLRVEAQEAGAT